MLPIGKMLVLAGGILVLLGIFLMFFDKLPFLGRLPGDITVRRENFEFHFPITTSLVLSVFVSVVLWLVSHWKGK